MALDDLVALPGGLDVLGREVALRDEVFQRLAADEAFLEEALLGGELALGVLQGDLGLRDAGPHVGEGLGLRDVRLDLGQDVAGLHDGAVANLEGDDAARHDGLDVHLGLGVDDADLADAHLEVFGLDLSEPEGRLLGLLALFLAAGREDDASPCQQETTPADVMIHLTFFDMRDLSTDIRTRSRRSSDRSGPSFGFLPQSGYRCTLLSSVVHAW